jgi:anti-sigma factor RsiW
MRCIEISDLLDLFIDGELADETRARVERHLLRCAECAFQIRTLEQTRSLLREAYPSAESFPAFREKMAARLQDAFRDVLRSESADAPNQRSLPFLHDAEKTEGVKG